MFKNANHNPSFIVVVSCYNAICLPKESQLRKNAYDMYFPLLSAFTFEVEFEGKKQKVAVFVFFWRGGGGVASSVFSKKWSENPIPFFFLALPI